MTPEAKAAEIRGYAAFVNGCGVMDCPYKDGDEAYAWFQGFMMSMNTPRWDGIALSKNTRVSKSIMRLI